MTFHCLKLSRGQVRHYASPIVLFWVLEYLSAWRGLKQLVIQSYWIRGEIPTIQVNWSYWWGFPGNCSLICPRRTSTDRKLNCTLRGAMLRARLSTNVIQLISSLIGWSSQYRRIGPRYRSSLDCVSYKHAERYFSVQKVRSVICGGVEENSTWNRSFATDVQDNSPS